MKNSLRIVTGLIMVLLLAGSALANRPRDPWVLRTTLDDRPHILVVALHDDLWVTYDVSRNALFKVLSQSINFVGGPVYTWAHGPMPTSTGTTYFSEPADPVWQVFDADGNNVLETVRYRGHMYKGTNWNTVFLLHELVLTDGTVITVTEQPEVSARPNRPIGFIQAFEVADRPEGLTILVALPPETNLDNINTNGEIVQDGNRATLSLNEIGLTVVTIYVD